MSLTDEQVNERVAQFVGAVKNNAGDWVHEDFGVVDRDGFLTDPRAWAAVLEKCATEKLYGSVHFCGNTCISFVGGKIAMAPTPGRAICAALLQALNQPESEA